MRPTSRSRCAWIAVAAVLIGAHSASAQRLEDNDFNIDAAAGPVLGSSRVVGLGGAYTALASGIGTVPWNPAGYAARRLYELEWFEWGIDASIFAPGSFGQNDFYNNDLGEGFGVDDFTFVDLGLRLQFGPLGVGIEGRGQIYSVPRPDQNVDISVVTLHYGAGWMFFDGQLVVGAGLRTAFFNLRLAEGRDTLADFVDSGFEAGFVLGLEGRPWRLGVTGRTPVKGEAEPSENVVVDDGVRKAAGFVLPKSVRLPWELQVGFAVQLGPRPLNRRWQPPADPEPRHVRELRDRWCQRELAQLRREARRSRQALRSNVECPRLPRHPRDPEWWEAEHARRKQEEGALWDRIQDAEDRIAERRDEDYEDLPRRYWLLSADLLLIGPTARGIGVDAFIDQRRRRSGKAMSVSVRLGLETEAVPNWLKLRAGTYLEPGRNAGIGPRVHGTFGFDVRLFTWDVFGLFDDFTLSAGAVIDGAKDWIDFGATVGFWH